MTWEKMKDRIVGKNLRGARKRMWLDAFYSALSGAAVHIKDDGHRSEAARRTVEAARFIADVAVAAEFDSNG